MAARAAAMAAKTVLGAKQLEELYVSARARGVGGEGGGGERERRARTAISLERTQRPAKGR